MIVIDIGNQTRLLAWHYAGRDILDSDLFSAIPISTGEKVKALIRVGSRNTIIAAKANRSSGGNWIP